MAPGLAPGLAHSNTQRDVAPPSAKGKQCTGSTSPVCYNQQGGCSLPQEPTLRPTDRSGAPTLVLISSVQMFVPYIDIMSWPTPQLQPVIDAVGQKFYTLAFITAKGTQPAWAGVVALGDQASGGCSGWPRGGGLWVTGAVQ